MGQSSKSGSAGVGGVGGGGGVVCPSTAISGCASGTALIQLDATGPGAGGAGESEHERGTWTGRFDFLLSLLGYSVGLGNVWRFPYLCYNNGGGAFLIPFTIMLVIAGLPLMFMELSFGQYAALGPVAVYRRFCPLFRGLGTGMILVSAIVMLYYNLIIAWTIFYMFASFAPVLPWQNCEPAWSTKYCFSYAQADQCEATNGTYYLRTCHNATSAAENNITTLALGALKRPPAEEYFNNFVLGLSKGIEETGSIKLSLAACLFLAWTIVFLCLCKGVQSSGKVVYFTALFPYVVLVILFVRGVTLPGASTGILFYLTPDWKQLANAQVWGDAAVQIFFALSPAWGGLITLSSYNKFSNNCYKDSLIVAFCNIATSFFAGLVIFSIIGFLAHELNVDVEKVVDQGAGLAFIVYPEVVTRLPVSPVWAVLFFVMLLTLGLDSQFALMETVTTAILDRFPNLRQYKIWVVLSVAIFGYIGGLGFTTNSGMYWLQLMDKYAANWSVLLIAISECILIAWIYGSQRFLNDIQGMIGKRSWFWNFFWGIMWRYITPATLLFILFFNWVEYKPAKYGHYVYPMWADAVGWIVGLLPVLVIFLVAFQEIWRAPMSLSFRDRIKHLLQPTAEWGPAGRPCVNLHAERYQSQNYDGVTNTKILIEEEASPKQAANKKDRQLTLDVDVDVECLPLATVGKRPGAPKSMGKQGSSGNLQTNAKNGTHKSPTTEISPSKQPLIPSEKDNKSANIKVLAAGTQSSGRECTTMSTFAGGGEKKSTKVNLATGATSAAAPLASSNIATAATVAAATKSPPAAGVAPTTLVGIAATGTTVAAAANGKATLKTTISSGAVAATAAGGNKAASVAAATATVAAGKTPAAAMALNVAASVKVSQTDKTAPLKTTISASVATAPGGTKASTAPSVATAAVVSVSSGATVPAAASKAAAPLKATAPPPSLAAVNATQAAKSTPVAAASALVASAPPAKSTSASVAKTNTNAGSKPTATLSTCKSDAPAAAASVGVTNGKVTPSGGATSTAQPAVNQKATAAAAAQKSQGATATATPTKTALNQKTIVPSAGSGKGDVPSSRSTDTPPPAKGAASSNISAKSTKAGKTQANETSPTKSAVKPIKAGSTSPTKAVVSKPGASAAKTAAASAATATATAAGSSSSNKKAATSTAATLGSQAKTKGNASGAGTKK
uniref:Transporter n=1 Tax=Drosophila melanogaster TaxID=7227 RepID=Q9W1J0_DROME|nr:glycine transporter [Drosophila melanogaster]AAF47069.2 glycine transporter [Drosophila melanogaster]|eukprot:NP_611836.2 glycine transporter [Drosophila melanogaster]